MIHIAKVLRWLAALVAASVVVFWAAVGANQGWTKTSVPITTVDEVTGIEAIRYEKKFVPGLDFLGLGALASMVLVIGSVFFRRAKSNVSQP